IYLVLPDLVGGLRRCVLSFSLGNITSAMDLLFSVHGDSQWHRVALLLLEDRPNHSKGEKRRTLLLDAAGLDNNHRWAGSSNQWIHRELRYFADASFLPCAPGFLLRPFRSTHLAADGLEGGAYCRLCKSLQQGRRSGVVGTRRRMGFNRRDCVERCSSAGAVWTTGDTDSSRFLPRLANRRHQPTDVVRLGQSAGDGRRRRVWRDHAVWGYEREDAGEFQRSTKGRDRRTDSRTGDAITRAVFPRFPHCADLFSH